MFRLERWMLAGQVFHRPIEQYFGTRPVTIHGKIEHKFKRLSEACWRALAILFTPKFYLYLDKFRMNEKQLRRFKTVLAYLLEFDRRKWDVRAIRFKELEEASNSWREQPIPF